MIVALGKRTKQIRFIGIFSLEQAKQQPCVTEDIISKIEVALLLVSSSRKRRKANTS